jgi:hypothetical protein
MWRGDSKKRRAIVRLDRQPTGLDEPQLHQPGICERRHDNPLRREILISKAIITPGRPAEQALPHAGLPAPTCINGRSADSASTNDRARMPANNRRSGPMAAQGARYFPLFVEVLVNARGAAVMVGDSAAASRPQLRPELDDLRFSIIGVRPGSIRTEAGRPR